MKTPYSLRPLALALGLALAGITGASAAASTAQDLTDARREAQIWTTYGFNPHLRALDIEVDVNGSTALLSGTVRAGVEKDLAEQIALGTEGIDKVDNQLAVDANYVPKPRPATNGERDFATTVEDATITASVKSKLLWNDHTDGLAINVDTVNGRVKLSGTADTAAAKELATRLARNTDGVRAVDNQLVIDGTKPAVAATATADAAVSDAWITSKVKSTFTYSRWVDASDIDVATQDGVVSLKGEVESGAEKELAAKLAQDVRGVRKVDASGLTVAG